MECFVTAYACSVMPDIDPLEFRYGQLLTVSITLTVVVAARAFILVLR
ncbi:hypothetical protein H8A99_08800 [Bradyrhizobium sp. Arg68]|nr:hypothetical protein [Bradyrhizobium ivorense]MCC8936591.1 hypothetical protein [Bradyrhizobium ivorense]